MSTAQYHEAMESNNVGQKLSVAQQETDPERKRNLLDSVIDNLIKDSSAVLDNYQDEIGQFCNDPHYIVRVATIRLVFKISSSVNSFKVAGISDTVSVTRTYL